jgi:hypothetical protein
MKRIHLVRNLGKRLAKVEMLVERTMQLDKENVTR